MAILRHGSPFAGGPVARASLVRRGLVATLDAEWLLAPVCVVLLLLYPHPLAVPAAILGLTPTAARWVLHGRPWRATAFDLWLSLLVAGAAIGYAVALDAITADVRLTGFVAGLVLFAWLRESLLTPRQLQRAVVVALALGLVLGIFLLSIAAPFLRLDRAPYLGLVAGALEPLAIYRPLVDDPAILQRYRFYASGVGAFADVGLALTAGLAVAMTRWRERVALAVSALFFGTLLFVADNRGSMLAGALTLGLMLLAWRPRLFWLVPLALFGTFDLIALGLVQRGLDLRTVHERLEFWSNGLALASETPLTGVGLSVQSVRQVYRAAFQPSYPPFFHVHNIYVQGLLEQGILGLIGLIGLTLVTLALGLRLFRVTDRQARGAGLAAFGAAMALFGCGLTEVVALTTIGWVLLCASLGLLVSAVEIGGAQPRSGGRGSATRLLGPATFVRVGASRWLARPAWLVRLSRWLADLVSSPSRARESGAGRMRAGVVATVLVVVLLAVSGLWRSGVALIALNVGTNGLYRGSLAEDLTPAQQDRALSTAIPALRLAAALDPSNVAARRNLALALAAAGDRDAARRAADDARAITPADDQRALFGVGRAYVAVEAWGDAIDVWQQADAGPQLLRLGDRLRRGRWWQAGIMAYQAAARRAAPGRTAVDGISRTSLSHGESPDEAVGYLLPLAGTGGVTAYQAQLQIAQVRREAGQFDQAWMALQGAAAVRTDRRDGQLDLEQALLLIAQGRVADAEPLLKRASADINQVVTPVPEGSEPHYWLAYAEVQLGRPELAVEAARAGLANLPPEQASLRAPLLALLGDELLALGRPSEALATYQDGQRAAPNDRRFADGIARAQAALRSR